MEAILFYTFAALALGSALIVVAQRNPLYSALGLIVTLGSLAGIYGLLGSPFIAVLQIVVYAGAIMVLFLFVLMLLNVKREEGERREGRTLAAAGLVLALLLVIQVGTVLVYEQPRPAAGAFNASSRSMAQVLFSVPFLYAFEATSVLILSALVGAVCLAKKP